MHLAWHWTFRSYWHVRGDFFCVNDINNLGEQMDQILWYKQLSQSLSQLFMIPAISSCGFSTSPWRIEPFCGYYVHSRSLGCITWVRGECIIALVMLVTILSISSMNSFSREQTNRDRSEITGPNVLSRPEYCRGRICIHSPSWWMQRLFSTQCTWRNCETRTCVIHPVGDIYGTYWRSSGPELAPP